MPIVTLHMLSIKLIKLIIFFFFFFSGVHFTVVTNFYMDTWVQFKMVYCNYKIFDYFINLLGLVSKLLLTVTTGRTSQSSNKCFSKSIYLTINCFIFFVAFLVLWALKLTFAILGGHHILIKMLLDVWYLSEPREDAVVEPICKCQQCKVDEMVLRKTKEGRYEDILFSLCYCYSFQAMMSTLDVNSLSN